MIFWVSVQNQFSIKQTNNTSSFQWHFGLAIKPILYNKKNSIWIVAMMLVLTAELQCIVAHWI